jgi:hypothetical protein
LVSDVEYEYLEGSAYFHMIEALYIAAFTLKQSSLGISGTRQLQFCDEPWYS